MVEGFAVIGVDVGLAAGAGMHPQNDGLIGWFVSLLLDEAERKHSAGADVKGQGG
jgi:hypothetical protein